MERYDNERATDRRPPGRMAGSESRVRRTVRMDADGLAGLPGCTGGLASIGSGLGIRAGSDADWASYNARVTV